MSGFVPDNSENNSSNNASEDRNSRQSYNRAERREAEERRRSRREEEEEEIRIQKTYSGDRRSDVFKINGAGGAVEKFFGTYNEIIKDIKDEQVSKLFRVTGDITRDLASNLSFLVYGRPIGENYFWHLLVIEHDKDPVKSHRPYRDDRRSRKERNYSEYLATVDGMTTTLIKLIESWLETQVKVSGKFYNTACTIIPTESDLTKEEVVKQFIYSAEDANFTCAGEPQKFNADYLNRHSSVQGTLGFTYQPTTSRAGLPVRTDFMGTVGEVVERVNPNPMMANDSGATFVEIGGYVDARYIGTPSRKRRGRDRNDNDTYCFVPEIILSHADLYRDCDFGNFGRLCLALALLPSLNTKLRWMQQFQGTFSNDKTRDLGAFGYALDIPGMDPDRIPISDDDLNDGRKFEDIMETIFDLDGGADFALKIREGDIGYTTLKIFRDIYNGNKSAKAALLDKLDETTDNYFSEYFNDSKSGKIVAAIVRLPYGYWVDQNGTRSSEEIDMLAILTKYQDRDRDLLQDYYDCMNPNSKLNEAERISMLIDIYKKYTNNTFVLKGIESKVYFDPEFLKYNYEAVRDSDMAIEIEFDGDTRYGRMSGSSERYSLQNDLATDNRRGSSRSRRDRYAETEYNLR